MQGGVLPSLAPPDSATQTLQELECALLGSSSVSMQTQGFPRLSSFPSALHPPLPLLAPPILPASGRERDRDRWWALLSSPLLAAAVIMGR